jgi:uncharacterized membrane protein
MNRLLSIFVVLTWGVWIGGLVGVFLAVTSLNQTFADDRGLFGTAASGVFARFERVQLGVAAAALALTFAWRICRGTPTLKTVLFALFGLSTVAAVVETTYVAPKINQLRQAAQTDTPQFRKLHGTSMMLYTGSLGVLAIAGAVLPFAIAGESKRKLPIGSTTL